MESDKWCLNDWLQNMVFLRKFNVHFTQWRKQVAGPKNGHATRKSPGNIIWVTALVLILCKEDPPKLYKNEFATESNKWCLNGSLQNMVFFMHFIQGKNKSPVPKLNMPRGNLLDISLGLRFVPHFVQYTPSKVVQKRICNGFRHMVFKRQTVEICAFFSSFF